MKRYFLIILLFLSLIGLVSAGECTQSGYEYCYEDSSSYVSATAHAKIYWQFEDDNGVLIPNNDAIGNLYVKSGYEGTSVTNGYAIYSLSDWDTLWSWVSCDSIGNCRIPIEKYSFTPSSSGGRIKIASQGETFTKCLSLIALDTNLNSGYWAWVGAGYGWTGSDNCLNIKVVSACTPNCACDSNTIIGQTCNDGCGGTCQGTKQPECLANQEKCESSSYFLCSQSNIWENKGLVKGKCAVECTSDNECNSGNKCDLSQYKCISELPPEQPGTYYRYDSEVNTCSQLLLFPSQKTINDYITLQDCEVNIKKPENFIELYILIGLIVIVGGFFFFQRFIKSKRRR